MAPNRPRGRRPNVTGTGKPIARRGSGLGTGPVGGAGRGAGIGGKPRPTGGSFTPASGHRPVRSGGMGGGFGKVIILILLLLFGGGSGLTAMLGGDGGQSSYDPGWSDVEYGPQTPSVDLETLLNSLNTGSTSAGWDSGSNTGALDTSVVSEAREKYTKIGRAHV